VHGPYEPEQGHRFNANKLLLDPYAKALVGEVRWSDELFGYTLGSDNTGGQHWKRLVDTNQPDQRDEPLFTPGDAYQVTGRSLFVFVLQKHN
jgi:glycogen operon protein